MTSTSVSSATGAPAINRPNVVAVGTIVWLGSEVMFFAGLFAVYFTLRSTSPGLWASMTDHLNIPWATGNTIILVLSSFTCQFGVFAAERLQPRRTGPIWNVAKWGLVEWYTLTYIMGAVFVCGQIVEYANLVAEGLTISSNPYTSAFFFATGFHALHVTGGLFAFIFVMGRAFAVRVFGHKEATSAIVVSYYWHFVDVVWIGLYLVIYVLK